MVACVGQEEGGSSEDPCSHSCRTWPATDRCTGRCEGSTASLFGRNRRYLISIERRQHPNPTRVPGFRPSEARGADVGESRCRTRAKDRVDPRLTVCGWVPASDFRWPLVRRCFWDGLDAYENTWTKRAVLWG